MSVVVRAVHQYQVDPMTCTAIPLALDAHASAKRRLSCSIRSLLQLQLYDGDAPGGKPQNRSRLHCGTENLRRRLNTQS